MDETTSLREQLLTDTCSVICIEREGGKPQWLRTQPYNNEIIVIESSSYGNPLTKGYSMVFANVDAYLEWLAEQDNNGWHVTFIGDTEPLSDETIATVQNQIMNELKHG